MRFQYREAFTLDNIPVKQAMLIGCDVEMGQTQPTRDLNR